MQAKILPIRGAGKRCFVRAVGSTSLSSIKKAPPRERFFVSCDPRSGLFVLLQIVFLKLFVLQSLDLVIGVIILGSGVIIFRQFIVRQDV